MDLAARHHVFVAGDGLLRSVLVAIFAFRCCDVSLLLSWCYVIAFADFKTGQTKMKSVLTDFLVSAGIKPCSIVSYNHLGLFASEICLTRVSDFSILFVIGNNDGRNLSSPQQFRSKEISKSSVIDDIIQSNSLLYREHERPDHCVVIKYVPFVGDRHVSCVSIFAVVLTSILVSLFSKRAMDEYVSEIFMGGLNTIVLHNTCEDSLLAAPVILDLCILCELMERISYKTPEMAAFERFDPVLSVLSYLLKAPQVGRGTVVNALSRQRACIENILRACVALPPESFMTLENKCAKLRQSVSVEFSVPAPVPSAPEAASKKKAPSQPAGAPLHPGSSQEQHAVPPAAAAR